MGLLDGLIGVFTGLHGGRKAAQAQTQLDNAQKGVIDSTKGLSNWYNQQSNTDYLDTAAAKSGLANVRDQYKKTLAQGNSNMAAGGATTESKVALKTGLQKDYNGTVSRLVGYGTQYQNAMKRAYGGTLGTIYGINKQQYQPKIDSFTNLSQQGWTTAEKGFSDAAGNIPGKDAAGKAAGAAKWASFLL